jgi:hypothetical protein
VTTEASIIEEGFKTFATQPLPTIGESNVDATSDLDQTSTHAAQESDSSALNDATRNSLRTTEGNKGFNNTIAAAPTTSSPVNKEPVSNATTSEKTPENERKEVNQSSTAYPTTSPKTAQNLTNATFKPSILTTSPSTTIATSASTSSTSTVAPPTTVTTIFTTTTSTTTTSTTTTTTTTTTTVIMEFLQCFLCLQNNQM